MSPALPFFAMLFLLVLPGLACSENLKALAPLVAAHAGKGDWVALGELPSSKWDDPATQLEQADFSSLLTGGGADKTYVITCVPFSWEVTPEGQYRYWVFPTDETGFGWYEDRPLLLAADRQLEPSADRGILLVVSTLDRVEKRTLLNHGTGLMQDYVVPVFSVENLTTTDTGEDR